MIYSIWKSQISKLIALAIGWSMLMGMANIAPVTQKVSQQALMDACEVLDMDCTGVPAPIVRTIPTVTRAAGQYWPYPEYTQYVWLRYDYMRALHGWARGERSSASYEAYEVLLHETVHYLDYHVNKNMNGEVTQEAVCQSERLAWAVSNLWRMQHGLTGRWRWRDWYVRCSHT